MASLEIVLMTIQNPTVLTLLTAIAIAPILILGLWLIISESFASLVAQHRLRLRNVNERKRFRAMNLELGERSQLADLFLICAVGVLLIGISFALVWQTARTPLMFALLISSGLLSWHSQRKKRELKRRFEETDHELPQIVQSLCLLVSSGVAPLKSLDLISRRSDSILGRELRVCVNEIFEGRSISESLDRLTTRLATPGIRRFVTTLLVATERGAPLVPALVALVRDTQVEQRTRMLRQAGRTEIGLMIPVVFLLLPISVLFALFPSILQLQLFSQ